MMNMEYEGYNTTRCLYFSSESFHITLYELLVLMRTCPMFLKNVQLGSDTLDIDQQATTEAVAIAAAEDSSVSN